MGAFPVSIMDIFLNLCIYELRVYLPIFLNMDTFCAGFFAPSLKPHSRIFPVKVLNRKILSYSEFGLNVLIIAA